MGTLTTSMLLQSMLQNPSLTDHQSSLLFFRARPKKNPSVFPVMRLFGPAVFEASKLKVLFLGVDEKKHPGKLPRTYTLTHSDVTSMLTLAISQTINNSQVLKAFVHGDEYLLNNYPELQEALVWVYFHSSLPEFNKVECWGPLKDAAAPSNNKTNESHQNQEITCLKSNWEIPQPCKEACKCCFPPISSIHWKTQ
ncbi:Staygreen protein [Ancistrocladus abbreviatus]